eukprot:c20593_g1_i1 orf=456-1820(-)
MPHFCPTCLLVFAFCISLLCEFPTPANCASQHTAYKFRHTVASRKYDSPGFRISLLHRDFSNPNAGSMLEKMNLAIKRSGRRLKFFESFTKAQVASASVGTFRTPVSAGEGSYLTSLATGTPEVTFSAIVDTGSDLIWRQCEPCHTCYAQNGPIFDPSKSSTYKKASCHDSLCLVFGFASYCNSSCQYIYQYGDLSYTSGDFSYDSFTLTDTSGESHSLHHIGFGCGHDNEGSSFSGAGGIVGLGQGPLSLLSQLSLSKLSYCLVSTDDSTLQTSPMFFGNSLALTGYDVQSTPFIANPLFKTYYYIALKGISVGGKLLDIPASTFDLKSDGSGGLIIDSGTTLTFLVQAAYKRVIHAFKSAIRLPIVNNSSVGLDLCYKSQPEVPSLSFHFIGADINLPVANYFLEFDGLFCLALGSSDSISIFGNIQQQNFHFLYDRRARKLSFVPANCDEL